MKDRISSEELSRLMKRWQGEDREVAETRMAQGYSKSVLENLSVTQAATLRALLSRLIPQREQIDLVGFVDTHLHDPMGRGDRLAGMPPDADVIRLGLNGVAELGKARFGMRFSDLDDEQRDDIIRAMFSGEVEGAVWTKLPPKQFLDKVYSKALHGYFAHPKAWMRIGFLGPSYPEGYLWLGKAHVKARHNRNPGWEVL